MKKTQDSDCYQPTKVKDIDIDNILSYVDNCVRREEWETLSDLFYNLITYVRMMPKDIIVAYLVASLPGQSKIRYRKAFLEKCKSVYPNEDWNNL